MFKPGQIVKLVKLGHWEQRNGLQIGQTFQVIEQHPVVAEGLETRYDLRIQYQGIDHVNSENFELVDSLTYTEYKVGDRVRCRRVNSENRGYFEQGKVYVISEKHPFDFRYIQLNQINWWVDCDEFEPELRIGQSRHLKFMGKSGNFLKTDEIYKVIDVTDTHFIFELPNGKTHSTSEKFAKSKFMIPTLAEIVDKFSEKKITKYNIRKKNFEIHEVNIL